MSKETRCCSGSIAHNVGCPISISLRTFHFYCVRCEKRTEHVKVALDYICTMCENQNNPVLK